MTDSTASQWTIKHNGQTVTKATLTEVIAAGRNLRTPEEQLRAARTLMRAIDKMMLETPEELVAAQKASSPFATWWAMVEAENELAGEIIKDDAVVLSFMGSGASMNVTAGQIRKMLDAIFDCTDGEPNKKS